MPTLTLLSNNIFINPSFFELVGIDQASITSASATEINMGGVFSGGTFKLIGTGMTVVNVNGRDFINGGIVQTIEFRVINNNFNLTNLNMFGSVLGTAMLSDFNGSDQGAVERLFLGLDYTILGTTGNDTHVRNLPESLDGVAMTLTGNNSYVLAAGNDVVTDAGTGRDTMFGGTGNDELSGGIGNDSLLGEGDNDILRGEAGNDTLQGGTQQDALFGGEDDDLLRVDTGLTAGETFDGGTGNDTLSFAGLDFGSQGGYVVSLPSQSGNFNNLFGDFPISVVGIENLIGSEQGDGFFGDGLANVLDGRGGNDTLQGEGGNDTLIGGEGIDDLSGGADDDLLQVGPRLAAGESFDGGTGIDTLSFAGLDFGSQGGYVVVLGDQTVDFNTGGFLAFVTRIETVLGSVQGDSFSGDGLANLLDGREGNDTLVGLGGSDTLIGGTGIDRLFGGDDGDLLLTGSAGLSQGSEIYDGDGGIDTFSLEGLAFGGYRVNIAAQTADLLAGNFQVTVREVEIVIGSVDGDEITGGTGDDTLEGRQGNDTLIGGNGSDLLDGGTGADTMIGGQGNDLYFVDDAGDVVIETGNAVFDGLTDEVSSSVTYSISDAGAQFIERLRLTGTGNLDGTGNGLDNRITGNDGNNDLLGLGGNDSIFGGDGRDTLNGGSGNDSMFGNEGDDTYIVFDLLDVASEAVNGVTDEGGTDTVEAFVSYSLDGTDGRQFIENLTLIPGGNAVSGTGNGLDNIITGNEAVNVLDGLGGNDTLFGGFGNDALIGGDGFDRLFGGEDDDSFGVITSEGAVVGSEDSLDGGTGIDSVEFVSGAGVNAGIDLVSNEYSLDGFGTFGAILGIERVTTGSGDDGVVGNLDTTFIDVGAGNDSVELATLTTEARGGEGDDTLTLLSLGSAITINLSTLTLQTGFENLFLTSFDDNGTGTEAANLLAGGSGNDTLNGLGGADRLFGGFDGDELNGGAGNDTLDGGAGFDRLFGGADDDDFGLIISQAGIVVLEDSIDGGTGIDRVAFDSGAGVNASVDLQAGDYSFDGFGTAGAITGIERVTTGSGDDSVAGNGDTTFIDVGAGDDEVDLATLTTEARGGEGRDTLDLRALAGPASINLSTSTLQTGFENLSLTGFADNATGTDAANDLFGGFGNDTLNGLGGNDLMFGGDNNDRLSGGADSDTLNGDNGNDTLDGGTGTDRMTGNAGDDLYIVDSSGDVIIEVAGEGTADAVQASVTYVLADGVDVEFLSTTDDAGTGAIDLTGNGTGQRITGNAGSNRLVGGAGNDTLSGGAGLDSLFGGADDDDLGNQTIAEGLDDLDGGTGTDRVSFAGETQSLILLLDQGNYLTGSFPSRTIVDVEDVTTGSGNDAIVTTLATTRVDAGAGFDVVDLASLATRAIGGGEGDTLDLRRITGDVAINLGTSTLHTGFTTLFLGDGNDNGTGSAASDTILGGAGNDTLTGLGDVDRLEGGTGLDRLFGGSEDDFLFGGRDADVLDGGTGHDRLEGGDGNDTLLGGEGNDTLDGGAGGNVLNGGNGSNLFFGGELRDLVFGGADSDTVNGNDGNDELRGLGGDDFLFGGLGSDTIVGNEGADQLAGGGGSDMMFGNEGADLLNGGFGFDRLNGGTGADRFFHLGVFDHASDFVQDYSAAEGDILQFGIAGARRTDFQVNFANTPNAGSATVTEAFVIYRPTGQIIWALVDGGSQDSINVLVGGVTFDLLA